MPSACNLPAIWLQFALPTCCMPLCVLTFLFDTDQHALDSVVDSGMMAAAQMPMQLQGTALTPLLTSPCPTPSSTSSPPLSTLHPRSVTPGWPVSRWVYAEPGWARIAALAPLVVTCAEKGDPIAHQILQQGCQDLVKAVQAIAGQLQMTQPFTLVLAGKRSPTTDTSSMPPHEIVFINRGWSSGWYGTAAKPRPVLSKSALLQLGNLSLCSISCYVAPLTLGPGNCPNRLCIGSTFRTGMLSDPPSLTPPPFPSPPSPVRPGVVHTGHTYHVSLHSNRSYEWQCMSATCSSHLTHN